MARLRWAASAERDLIEIGEFIARDSVLYGVNVVERLVTGTERLASDPRQGRVVPEYGRDDLRELIVRSYRVVYLIRGEDVIVARVVHGAQDFTAVIGPRPWVIE